MIFTSYFGKLSKLPSSVLYREKYLHDNDPIINYWPHETIPHTIVVEHYSGFKRTFNVFEYPVNKRSQ